MGSRDCSAVVVVCCPFVLQVMIRDIAAAKDAGAHGVVVGVLTPDGTVDKARYRFSLLSFFSTRLV